MIRLQNLTLQRGPQRLLEGAELTLHAGHKAGLIGANGAGKSSLFALLRGELTPDAGDCLLPGDWRIAHMRQEVDNLERLAVDYVLDGDHHLRRVQAELAAAEQAHDGASIARLHSELDSADGYTADARARKLLAGLGFENAQMDRRVGDFSGGWRMRLNLAQALMCPSDLLLLDEPTNHLDLDAILWLEDWLKGYPGTLLLIAGLIMAVVYSRFDHDGRFPLSVGNALAEIGRCFARMRWSALTIVIVLSLAYVMNFSGQTVAMGTWVAGLGAAFVFLSPVLGWLGTAVTGSDTSANALFSTLQQTAATNIGADPALLVAANTSGGVVGKMISPQSLAIAATAVGMEGRESEILRRVVVWSLVLLLAVCTLVYLQSNVLAWMLPAAG